jgi:hypothetical protein
MAIRSLVLSHRYNYINIYEDYCNGIESMSTEYHFIDYIVSYYDLGKSKFERLVEDKIVNDDITHVFIILLSADLTIDFYFIHSISKKAKVVMNFFDTEHFFEFCDRYYAQLADLVILPDYLSTFRYQLFDIKAICTFSLFDSNKYVNQNQENHDIAVSFVGNCMIQKRISYLSYLKENNIQVQCHGKGSSTGFISFDDMVDVFNKSRINLNFTGTLDSEFLVFGKSITKRIKQCKGRPIEIALCGGFVLTEYAPGIENMFEIGKEIDVFRTEDELCEKIRYYLTHDEERNEIARKGYERASRDYTIYSGFERVFKCLEDGSSPNKTMYLDKDFIKLFVSYRFYYIFLFLLSGKFRHMFEELSIIGKYRRFYFRKAYYYSVKGASMFLAMKCPAFKIYLKNKLAIKVRI